MRTKRKYHRKTMDSGVRFALREAGRRAGGDPRAWHVTGKTWLAEALGITVQSINQWQHIPKNRLLMVHQLTGVPLEKLAPKIFR